MLLGQPAWETPDEVRAALEQTDAMTTLLIKNGSPRFSSVENVRGIVQRAEKGGVLSMAELCHDAPADAGKDDKGFDFVRK